MTARQAADLQRGLEAFFYHEADLLDCWELERWLELFHPEATYEVPATDARDGRPDHSLFIIADTMAVLRGRVQRLTGPHAFAERPPSRTRRFVSNVRVLDAARGEVRASANFMIARIRKGANDMFIGRYEHTLERGGDAGFRFRRRRAVLDLDALRPHGKVSIIL